MQRQIFIVSATIVDANGAYANLSGYPKTFDSHIADLPDPEPYPVEPETPSEEEE